MQSLIITISCCAAGIILVGTSIAIELLEIRKALDQISRNMPQSRVEY